MLFWPILKVPKPWNCISLTGIFLLAYTSPTFPKFNPKLPLASSKLINLNAPSAFNWSYIFAGIGSPILFKVTP